MIYTLTLNPAIDYDVFLDKLEIGEINKINTCNIRAGGKGINVSIVLNNLGIKSIALGYIAGFTGEYIKKDLENMNIKTDFLHLNSGMNRINTNINDKLNETCVSGTPINVNYENIENLKDKLRKLKKGDILVMSGSIPDGLNDDIYLELSKEVDEDVKIVLDANGDILLKNIYNNYLIKPNIHELERAFNVKIKDNYQIYNICQYFLDRNVKNIIVSLGSKGAVHITKEGFKYIKSPSGEYINSIGAGDSMVAGFIAKENLEFAVACGSATAYSLGLASSEKIYSIYADMCLTSNLDSF